MADDFYFDPDHPLDRCAGEHRAAHDALLDYYRMGSGRSLSAILAKYRNQADTDPVQRPPTRRFTTLKQWSTENRWQDRIQKQADLDLKAEQRAKEDAIRVEAAKWAERRLAVRNRDWDQAEELRRIADQVIEQAPKFMKSTRKFVPGKNGSPDREIITVALDGALMVRAIEAASKLQRLAAEMETEHSLTENVDAEDIEKVREKRWKDAAPALADALAGLSAIADAPQPDEGGEENESADQEGVDE